MRLAFVGFLGLALFFFGIPARADYFVWRDHLTGLSLSFPDSWLVVANKEPDDLVTVMAPGGRGNAVCRVRAREDRRYLIYPPRFSAAIQKIDYGAAFWETYLGEYEDARLESVKDESGLGRGFASTAVADYRSAVPGPYMSRKGLMFASLYNGRAYITECSSHRDAFSRWKDDFLSIAKSVDFRKAHHEVLTGDYRNFMKDPFLPFAGVDGHSVSLY